MKVYTNYSDYLPRKITMIINCQNLNSKGELCGNLATEERFVFIEDKKESWNTVFLCDKCVKERQLTPIDHDGN